MQHNKCSPAAAALNYSNAVVSESLAKCTISKQEKMVIEAFQINLAFVLASQQQYFNQALFLRQKVIIINFLSSFAQARNL